jgi:ribosome biogenesis GTPase
MPSGLVIGVTGPQLVVRVGEQDVSCGLRGRLKKERKQVTTLVVVGDNVDVTLLPDGTGVIESVAPRRTELTRPGFANRARVVAANLDQLVVVQATHKPRFNRHLVERFLTIAAGGGLRVLVVVNKCDLEDPAVVEAWVQPLRASGVAVLLTNAKTGQGVEALRAALAGKLSAMVGQSGVGKSSLLNALDPSLQIRTAEISDATSKGKHTTTASRLYPLAVGGYLVDTPGIRELALFEGDPDSLAAVFPEITEAAAGCRFRGCSHSHEPGCAVKQKVAQGEIEQDRYEHFVKLSAGG